MRVFAVTQIHINRSFQVRSCYHGSSNGVSKICIHILSGSSIASTEYRHEFHRTFMRMRTSKWSERANDRNVFIWEFLVKHIDVHIQFVFSPLCFPLIANPYTFHIAIADGKYMDFYWTSEQIFFSAFSLYIFSSVFVPLYSMAVALVCLVCSIDKESERNARSKCQYFKINDLENKWAFIRIFTACNSFQLHTPQRKATVFHVIFSYLFQFYVDAGITVLALPMSISCTL